MPPPIGRNRPIATPVIPAARPSGGLAAAGALVTNKPQTNNGFVDGFDAPRGTTRANPVGTLSREERLDAVRRMAEAARAAGVPPELPVIVALVESQLNNPTGGDRDSVGMFQQRDNWGSNADRMDIDRATDMFLNGGQERGTFGATHWADDFPANPTARQLGRWAQHVQGSAYPRRYEHRVAEARQLLHDAGVSGY